MSYLGQKTYLSLLLCRPKSLNSLNFTGNVSPSDYASKLYLSIPPHICSLMLCNVNKVVEFILPRAHDLACYGRLNKLTVTGMNSFLRSFH